MARAPRRVAGAAGHETRQIRLALDHLLWRMPVRPLGLLLDRLGAGPGEALAADADAVAQRAAVAEHQIEEGVGRIDHDRARRFVRGVADDLAFEFRRQLGGLLLDFDRSVGRGLGRLILRCSNGNSASGAAAADVETAVDKGCGQ